jgi:predicted RNA binding protein YcfA (HicA-like mRNA interferase family)
MRLKNVTQKRVVLSYHSNELANENIVADICEESLK